MGFAATLGLVLWTAAAAGATPGGYAVRFTMPPPGGPTSGGVYDADSRLVRTLWTLADTPPGEQRRTWDGTDDFGRPVPKEAFTYKVVTAAAATNVGAIGNTGRPTTTAGHVPNNFEAVAVDRRRGTVLTVHDWDEPRFDVIEWDGRTGLAVGNSGHVVEGLVKGLAVDAEDGTAFVSAYERLDDPATATFCVARLDRGPDGRLTRGTFTRVGRMIRVEEGPIPPGTPPGDRELMRMPLQSLALGGRRLYVADARAGLVRTFDKRTGEPTGGIRLPLPRALAVAPDGRVWVGHDHHRLAACAADGTGPLAAPLVDLTDVRGLAFGPDGDLYVADQGTPAVRRYHVHGDRLDLALGFGGVARPGDRAADRFYDVRGVAVGGDGTVVTAQDEYFFNGGRLAAFAADGRVRWEQLGLEFQSIGTYGSDDPGTFLSVMHHAYAIDAAAGRSAYLGNTVAGPTSRGGGVSGSPRVVRLGGATFFYLPSGDGIEVFRLLPPAGPDRGPRLALAAAVAGSGPWPDGHAATRPWLPSDYVLWSWHDAAGGGGPPSLKTADVAARPGDGRAMWQRGPMTADAGGNLWFASYARGGSASERNGIYMIPLRGLDPAGNPVYRWADARPVVVNEQTWGVQLKTVAHGTGGGLTYAYGLSRAYPAAPQNGGLHMGGNLLMCYGPDAAVRWAVPLGQVSVGLDVAPAAARNAAADGVVVGTEPFAGGISVYSADGLVVARTRPSPTMGVPPADNPSGCLDTLAAIAANRDPRDGLLDVFVEDDYNDRILWYRIDDRRTRTISGPVTPAAENPTTKNATTNPSGDPPRSPSPASTTAGFHNNAGGTACLSR